jgi:hypothetical protein
MRDLAQQTGGRSFINNNDLAGTVQKAVGGCRRCLHAPLTTSIRWNRIQDPIGRLATLGPPSMPVSDRPWTACWIAWPAPQELCK